MTKDFEIENSVLIKYKSNGGNVVIPNGVTEIGDGAFEHCGWVKSINIPDSVTEIHYGAFRNCGGLISINIPDSVTKIGAHAFSGCSGLTSIVIPDSVTEIGYGAFRYCTGLTSINIPNSVMEIDNFVFYGCGGLISINIPDSVKVIGVQAFYGCNGFTSINIPNSVVKIGDCAFGYTKTKRKPQGNVAYKGFNANMTCRGFQYEEGKTYVCGDAKLCVRGFHACLNPLDCFNYYCGDDVVYHEVILEHRTNETNDDDSKVCGRKITIGRRLTIKEMSEIFNELNEEK